MKNILLLLQSSLPHSFPATRRPKSYLHPALSPMGHVSHLLLPIIPPIPAPSSIRQPRPRYESLRCRHCRFSSSIMPTTLSSAETSPRRNSRPNRRPSHFPNPRPVPSVHSMLWRTTMPRRPKPARPLQLLSRIPSQPITAPSPKCPLRPNVRAAS